MRCSGTFSRDRIAQLLRCAAPVVALLTCVSVLPKQADAASVDIFLIAAHSAPSSATGAPLSVTTQTVYQLGGLNGNSAATSATLVNNFSFNIDTALTFSSQNNPSTGPGSAPGAQGVNVVTDEGEAGAGNAAYINSQVANWDNSGIAGTTVDANEQVDFGRNSSMTFNKVADGFTDLILADLGGLNPFDLFFCPDAICSTTSKIFGGLNSGLRSFLTGTGLFATSDTGVASNQDQSWLFRFASPIMDFVKVVENDDRNVYTGERLQVDFIGAKSATTTQPPSPVPGPASLPLLAGGFLLMGWSLRRRKG